ncbi:MAG TPA: hypothetical protein DDZ11_04665 [Lentisphaeria bacterium]|nr:hypothetical protein [Lentisphaeria bacterium]
MKHFSVFLALGLFLPLSGEEAVGSPGQTEKFQFQPAFQQEFNALFETLKQRVPEFTDTLNRTDAERALAAAMHALRRGIQPAEKPEHIPTQKNAVQEFSISGQQNEPRCLQINILSASAFRELLRIYRDAANGSGLILDLRNCSGGIWDGNAFEKLLAEQPIHTAILLSSKTCGAAEILAAKLMTAHRGIGIGEPSAGRPYPRELVHAGSRTWLLPRPPKDAADVPYEKIIPQITTEKQPEAPGDTQKTDPALRRASDLLISLNLLDQKGLKK